MKQKLLTTVLAMTCISSMSFAQTREVSGIVTSADGTPISGASVSVVGTNIATQTDGSGQFKISASSGATLNVSYIGYTSQRVSIGNSTNLTIVLQGGDQALDEVIVVAYGTTTKESFTGAASVVSSKNLENRQNSSFQKALQGAAPGLQVTSVSGQPGAATQIRIRGEGSITGGSAPLYVIDGVAISSTGTDLTSVAQTADVLSSLNPNDIESVTVLKDASAAAIYGSRAANGVILVTTKKGKAGATKFNVNASSGVSSEGVKKHEVLNAHEYFKLYYDTYYAAAIAQGSTPANAVTSANTSTINRLTQLVGGVRYNNPFNTLQPFDSNGNLANGTVLLYDTDWRSEVLRKGVTEDLNVSASGGSEKLKYYASGGYFNQKGIVLASAFKRYTGKFNLENEVNNFFSFGINNTLSNSRQDTPPGAGGGANPVRFADLTANIYSVYERDADGKIRYDVNGKPIYSYTNPVTPDMNPVGLSELDDYITRITRINTSPFLQVKFLEGFTARSTVSLDYSAIRENQFYNMLHGNGVAPKGRGYRYSKEDITSTFINTLTYNKSIQQHNVDVLLGHEAYKNKYDQITAMAVGFAFPGQTELVSASTPNTASSSYTEARFNSYFSRLNYDYSNRYYFSGSFRRDGYSAFGLDNKYGNFYSLGGAWRISKEEFFKDITFVNELKLRASYGVSGNNSGITRYQWQGLYGIGYSYEGSAGITYTQLEVPDLRWERNKSTEIGLEFGILDNKINGEISYFNRASDGLLFSKPISRTTGFSSIISNLAEMRNRGIELNINASPVRTDDFRWDIAFNITKVNNKVTALTQEEVADGTKMLRVGENRFQWYLREYAGIDKEDGRPMWYTDDADGNKVTTKAYASAKQYTGFGSSMPDFYGGINNTLAYRGFDLAVFTYYSVGGKIYDALYASLMHNGISPGQQMSKDVLNAWSATNKDSDIPRFLTNNNTDLSNSSSTRFLFDGSYFRVKNITLGYSFQKDWITRAKLSNLRLFVMAENPLTWAKHKGFDPEASIAGSRDNDIPSVKTFSAGLTVGF